MLQRFFPDYTLTAEEVVTIAFAHITQYTHRDITLSDKLFQGLGIKSKRQKVKLLRRVRDFNYIWCRTRNDFLAQMASHYWSEQMRSYAMDLSDLESTGADTDRRNAGFRLGHIMLTSILVVGAFTLGRLWPMNRKG
jgi:hypothetical protein